MSKFKKVKYSFTNKAGYTLEFTADVQVDVNGWFYANLPDVLLPAFPESLTRRARPAPEGYFIAMAPTFDALDIGIKTAATLAIEPEVEEVPVIRYSIGAQIAFAETADGTIFPNAGFPGARWAPQEQGSTEISANSPAKGGYSLTIGAKALIKQTTRYGDKETVKYFPYYKGGSHLGQDNPAQLLNAWAAFTLPANAQEMPYSDEAASFFYHLLMSMAQMVRTMKGLNDRKTLERSLQAKRSFLLTNESPFEIAKELNPPAPIFKD